MATITNNHQGPIGLPNGIVLAPGSKTLVPSWPDVAGNAVVKAWVRNKILAVEAAPDALPDPPADDRTGEQIEKDDLIAALADFGIEKTRRSSVESLRAALEDAKLANAAGE